MFLRPGRFATVGIMLPATFATCITVVANATFNYVFIYGYGSFEGLGFIGSPLATVLSFCVQLAVFTLYAVVIRGSQRACPVGWRSFLTTVCRAGYHKDYWFGWSMQSISWGCPILTKS